TPLSPDSLQRARARLSVLHPLQPFSVAYFEPDADPRRRSFNEEYCESLKQRLLAQAAPASSAFTAVTEDTGEPHTAIEFEDESGDDKAWEPQERFFQAPLSKVGPEFHAV